MGGRRRVDPHAGAAALAAWADGQRDENTLATAVRYALEELATRAPGGSVEVRVPPLGAAQCIEGTRHTRGTPPNVIEMDPVTWLELVTGKATWSDAVASGRVGASGAHANLDGHLPLD